MLRIIIVLIFIKEILCQNCGNNIGICINNECCSQYGWCGSTVDHCSNGCQKLFGRCDGDSNLLIYECSIPNTIALTFDDGVSQYTSKLLNILYENNVKATFFINGITNINLSINNKNTKNIIKRMFLNGHQIAHHTWSHKDLTLLSTTDLLSEINLLSSKIQNIIGKRPRFLRPPYGNLNENVISTLTNLTYRIALWSLDTEDWNYGPPNIQDKFINLDKKIVLHHDTLSYVSTVYINDLIKFIKSQNLQIKTLAECLNENAYF